MTLLQQFRSMLEGLEESEQRTELTNSFDKVEEALTDAISTRDKAKRKAKELETFKANAKDTFEIEDDDFTIDTIKEILAKKGKGKVDESELSAKHEGELKKLRDLLSGAEGKNTDTEAKYNDLLFKSEIENNGLLKGFKDNPLLRETVVNSLKSQLLYRDGKIYVNDGEGNPAKDITKDDVYITPETVVKGMKENAKWADFINPQGGHGGGTPPSNGNVPMNNSERMSPTEKMKQGR